MKVEVLQNPKELPSRIDSIKTTAKKIQRRMTAGIVGAGLVALSACSQGTEVGKPIQQTTLTVEPQGTLDPGIHSATSTPENPLFTGTPFPFPTGTDPESDKDGTPQPFPTVEENDPQPGWTKFEYADLNGIGFNVNYPDAWNQPTGGSLDEKYPFFIPFFKNGGTNSPEFLIEWQPALNIEIDYYAKQLSKQILENTSSSNGSATIEEERITTSQGLEGVKLKILTPPGSASAGSIQYLLLTGDGERSFLWELSYISYAQGNVFDEESTFQQFVDSFQADIAEKSVQSDWTTQRYSSQSRGFTVDVPSTWKSEQKEDGERVTQTFNLGSSDGVQAELSILSELIANNDIESYRKSAEKQYISNIKAQYGIDVEVNYGYSRILGQEAWKLEADTTAAIDEKVTYVFITPDLSDESRFYGWQISLTSDPNTFNGLQDTFYQILNSFNITNTEN